MLDTRSRGKAPRRRQSFTKIGGYLVQNSARSAIDNVVIELDLVLNQTYSQLVVALDDQVARMLAIRTEKLAIMTIAISKSVLVRLVKNVLRHGYFLPNDSCMSCGYVSWFVIEYVSSPLNPAFSVARSTLTHFSGRLSGAKYRKSLHFSGSEIIGSPCHLLSSTQS